MAIVVFLMADWRATLARAEGVTLAYVTQVLGRLFAAHFPKNAHVTDRLETGQKRRFATSSATDAGEQVSSCCEMRGATVIAPLGPALCYDDHKCLQGFMA